MHKFRLFCTVAAFAICLSPSVFAHEAQPDNAAVKPAASAAAIPPATRAALDRSLAAYKALTSYRDTQLVKFATKFKGGEDPSVGRMVDQETTLSWAAPNKLAMSAPFVSVMSDGALVTCSIPSLQQYTQGPLPTSVEPGAEMDIDKVTPATWLTQHDVALLLMRRPADGKDLLFNAESWGEAKAETLNGEEGVRISGTMKGNPMMGGGEAAPFSVFIADGSGLIREIRRDMTEIYRDSMMMHDDEGEGEAAKKDKPTLEKAEWVYAFGDVKLNEPIADSVFAFKADEGGMKKVAKFDFNAGRGGDPQKAMFGAAAPVLKAKMLDGSDFDLASLKGRIVLLDFWATWCGPCVQAIPKVQKVADKFADKHVTVLGVNQDRGDTEKVSAFLKRKNITLKQVMDVEGQIGTDFKVTGIPCLFIIDEKGVVQDIHVGAGPGIEGQLTSAIEKLLRGEPLHTRDEIAEFHKAAEETPGDAGSVVVGGTEGEADQGLPADAPAVLKPLNAEKITAGNKIAVNGWQSMRRDIDGDGREELLVPDAQGGLVIIASDGASSRTIRFKGAGQFGVTAAAPATLKGQRGWVIGGARYDGPGQAPLIGFFDEEGKNVWQYKPELGDKGSSQMWLDAADLDGDGTTETIALVTVFEMKKTSANSYENQNPRSVLMILDESGALISSRAAGKYAHGMYIAAPSAAGGRRSIVVVDESAARMFSFDPRGQPAQTAEPVKSGP